MALVSIEPKNLSNEFSVSYTVDGFSYAVAFTTVQYGDPTGSTPQMQVSLFSGETPVKQNIFSNFGEILGVYLASFTRDGLTPPTEEFAISVIQEAFRLAALADYEALASVVARIYGFTIVVPEPE
jgi:hypothetical protein